MPSLVPRGTLGLMLVKGHYASSTTNFLGIFNEIVWTSRLRLKRNVEIISLVSCDQFFTELYSVDDESKSGLLTSDVLS